jgi:hypothetical protein
MDPVVEGFDAVRPARARGVLLLGPERLSERGVHTVLEGVPPAPSLVAVSDKYGAAFVASATGAWRPQWSQR